MCTGCLPAAVCRLRIATLASARSMPGLKWIMPAALSRFSLSNLHFHSACIHKGEQQFLPCRLNRNLRLAQRDWGSDWDWDGNRERQGLWEGDWGCWSASVNTKLIAIMLLRCKSAVGHCYSCGRCRHSECNELHAVASCWVENEFTLK